jgi:hypothetical protein
MHAGMDEKDAFLWTHNAIHKQNIHRYIICLKAFSRVKVQHTVLFTTAFQQVLRNAFWSANRLCYSALKSIRVHTLMRVAYARRFTLEQVEKHLALNLKCWNHDTHTHTANRDKSTHISLNTNTQKSTQSRWPNWHRRSDQNHTHSPLVALVISKQYYQHKHTHKCTRNTHTSTYTYAHKLIIQYHTQFVDFLYAYIFLSSS